MRRTEKAELVSSLSERLGGAAMVLVAEFRGITVAESNEMRRRLRAVAGEFKVVKNTFVRRAIEGTSWTVLGERLGGPVGLILSFGDPVALASAVVSLRDLGDRFKLRGGVLGGKTLSAEDVRALAAMPPREVLLAQLLGLLMAPAASLVRLINEPGSALARVVEAVGKKQAGAAA
jgi:large subunit ribosomal protein L10